RGIAIGVLSNFDSRLYAVLKALNLVNFFSSTTISTEVGAAKPSPQIFNAALNKHDCPAELAWHVGDSFKEDYQAAQAAGLRGIWLNRKQN
ncbi:MAG: HAD-IA family hydrolase, partial [Leptolyngbyaceae cyanobacterium SU_3_3]|nr:HAD-IA family hydrolase [Leptolyngbyaceae cyanobacterium SU_3_3]